MPTITNILPGCCPKAPATKGGFALGGRCPTTCSNDAYEDFFGFWDLSQTGSTSYVYLDKSHFHNDGEGGNGHNSALVPTLNNGVFCQPSQYFNGTTFISLESLPAFNSNQDFSISCWANVNDFYNTRTFLSLGNATFGYNFLGQLQATVNVINSDATTSIITVNATAKFTFGTWYHFAMTFEPAAFFQGNVSLYQNGTFVGGATINQTELAPVTEAFIASNDGLSGFPTCNIQDMRLYNEAKDLAYWAACYNNVCNYNSFVGIGTESF